MSDSLALGTPPTAGRSRNLVLAAMIFAVAMTFIDQTIVSVAAPKIQAELSLSGTGIQWAINAYLLALAALFAFGGRLADTVGPRPMVVIGIVVFALSSALAGLTPKGSFAEAWLVIFRAVQGLGGALMYPAALAIVVTTYEVKDRGKALALFFGIAGGLTAVGPVLGGYLTIWTWRAIFWVNVPVAIIALVLVAVAKPESQRRPARLDLRGLILIVAGVALSVFGFQQSAQWGWTNPLTALSIALGAVLLIAFVRVEQRTLESSSQAPLMNVSIFRDREFLTHNVILLIAMMAFVPVFFFASEYAEVALGEKASVASLSLLYFFAGFVVAAQIGGRMLDRVGARRPIVLGTALATVGFALWADHVHVLAIGHQITYIVIAGAGMGMMLGQANTAALNRAPSTSYGEATGITQTIRNYGASLGLAILGTVLVTVFKSHLVTSLTSQGEPAKQAHRLAAQIAELHSPTGGVGAIPAFVKADFASATQVVLYAMAGITGLAFLVAVRALPRTAPSRVARYTPSGRGFAGHSAQD